MQPANEVPAPTSAFARAFQVLSELTSSSFYEDWNRAPQVISERLIKYPELAQAFDSGDHHSVYAALRELLAKMLHASDWQPIPRAKDISDGQPFASSAIQQGSLVIAGTGITVFEHITQEAIRAVRDADVVLHLLAEPFAREYIRRLNPRSVSLTSYLVPGVRRDRSHAAMTAAIMDEVRACKNVCAVFYGHPLQLVRPAQFAIAQARSEGFPVRVLPGVSAFDCLTADLGIDPAEGGCQLVEANDIMTREINLNSACHVIVWQIGLVGLPHHPPMKVDNTARIAELAARLEKAFPRNRVGYIYEAAHLPGCRPMIQEVKIRDLDQYRISPFTTLYIPPKGRRMVLAKARGRGATSNANIPTRLDSTKPAARSTATRRNRGAT